MIKMNIVDVINAQWPNAIKDNLVSLGIDSDDGPILIKRWNIAGDQRPTEKELLDLIPALEAKFKSDKFTREGSALLSEHINKVAKSKDYESALSCVSYRHSLNAEWALDAATFSEWRDACWAYAIDMQSKVNRGEVAFESFDSFIAGLPTINW